MKILVITDKTQGRRKNDFHHATVGEPAIVALACDKGCVAGSPCGCERSFTGLNSLKSSTTVEVAENPRMTTAKLKRSALKLYAQVLGRPVSELTQADRSLALGLASEALNLAEQHEVGTVLEVSRFVVKVRATEPKAPKWVKHDPGAPAWVFSGNGSGYDTARTELETAQSGLLRRAEELAGRVIEEMDDCSKREAHYGDALEPATNQEMAASAALHQHELADILVDAQEFVRRLKIAIRLARQAERDFIYENPKQVQWIKQQRDI